MALAPQHVTRLEAFLDRIHNQVYPEPPSPLHTELTSRMLLHLASKYPLPPWARVLDVGCGQGVALELFASRGCRATGIALGAEDVRACREKGFQVLEMDQSFLDFPETEFDLLWCRHCLEHSVFPLFTLSEFFRVLRPAGLLYVEVPAPDTSCQHQGNQNHYSVLTTSMWGELIRRSGFEVLEAYHLNFTTGMGPDTYYVFISRKPGDRP